MMEPSQQEYEKDLTLTHENEEVEDATEEPDVGRSNLPLIRVKQHVHHHHHSQPGIGDFASQAMHFGAGIVIGAGIALLGGVIGASISRRNVAAMSKKVLNIGESAKLSHPLLFHCSFGVCCR